MIRYFRVGNNNSNNSSINNNNNNLKNNSDGNNNDNCNSDKYEDDNNVTTKTITTIITAIDHITNIRPGLLFAAAGTGLLDGITSKPLEMIKLRQQMQGVSVVRVQSV